MSRHTEEIKKLLPHRHPFLFVDKILSATKEKVIGIKTFNRKKDKLLLGNFPELGFIPRLIIIESMAQCGGAGVKKVGLVKGFFGLVSMNNIQFFKDVTYGEKLRYEIQNIKVNNRIIKQRGAVYCKKSKIAEATWTSIIWRKPAFR